MQKSTELNIKLNAKDKCEWTAFHLAYKNGRLGIIELLIQKSAEFNIEVNDKVETGRTAFHLAYKNGHLEICSRVAHSEIC